MIKLLAIDLDGTMYTTDRKITQVVRDAIQEAVDNGIQPVIVTGRGRRGAELALENLDRDFPYISSAGASIRSGLNGEIIGAFSFHQHDEVLQVIDFSRSTKTGLITESIEGHNYWFGPDAMNEIMDPLTVTEALKSFRTTNPELDFDMPLLKITMTAPNDLLKEAVKLIETNCPSLDHVFSGTQYIDLTAKGVNKGSALQVLAKEIGINRDEIASIGDQEIDLEMLKYSGMSFAMENAVASLKNVASFIAPSNDKDGVAWAIKKIIQTNNMES